jgi:hypothetical protein
MTIHVLPGDAAAADFKKTNIRGETIVCRECLIEGEVLKEFWAARANFIAANYGGSAASYAENVAGEFEKLIDLSPGAEVNLWFEYELFCQANMWFCLSLLAEENGAEIYRVAPIVRSEDEIWKGFGRLSAVDLRKCLEAKIKFSEADVRLGKNLWEAYREKDFQKLKELSRTESRCFPKLKEVCEAEIEKSLRPKETLEKILASGETDFHKIFEEFAARQGVYGFGDAQVRRILGELRTEN